jgi:catechol 2,3-dioxygenase-like lactoylglutathione lyase family enzyme
MLTSITVSSLFVTDQDEALAFYVGTLGLEVHTDADLGFMRWLTVNVPGDKSREILLERPAPPSMDDATAEGVRASLAKGAAGGWIAFQVDDARAEYERLAAAGVDITDEPSEKSYGIDFGIRDPFGNKLRLGQRTAA